MAFKFYNGVYVIDRVTGLAGVIVARTDCLTGCNRYTIQAPLDKDGKVPELYFVDEHSLVVDETKQRLKLDRDANDPPG
jgi:hypothetical protein